MNNDDLKAFDEWRKEYISTHAGYFKMIGTDDLAQVTWQAACEYKEVEVKAYVNHLKDFDDEIGRLQAENKKLREGLNALRQNLKWDHGNSEIIREALKEVENK